MRILHRLWQESKTGLGQGEGTILPAAGNFKGSSSYQRHSLHRYAFVSFSVSEAAGFERTRSLGASVVARLSPFLEAG